MKWFNKWLTKKMKQAWNEAENPEDEPKYANAVLGRPKPHRSLTFKSDEGLHSRGVSFTLYNANGGSVVELRDYDPMSDRHSNVLYVISKDQDLGQQLGHIVTMEALKR